MTKQNTSNRPSREAAPKPVSAGIELAEEELDLVVGGRNPLTDAQKLPYFKVKLTNVVINTWSLSG
jgi:hypothetical protein